MEIKQVSFGRIRAYFIKTKYISTNQSKNPDTILAAILRSLTSRNVEVTTEDIGSPE